MKKSLKRALLLKRAARLLDRHAVLVRASTQISGEWPFLDVSGDRRSYRELRKTAKELRKLALKVGK